MNVSDYSEQYAQMADEELLCTWADRASLTPEASLALQSEVQKRGLKTANAARLKKRMDTLFEREQKGPLSQQVASAKYEHDMRRFIGWEEPKFYSPYGGRDIRRTFASIRHKYRVWTAFRDHTGHWPTLSIVFAFASWIAIIASLPVIIYWLERLGWSSGWSAIAIIGYALAAFGAQALGAQLMRKLDWKIYGNKSPNS